MSFLAQYDGTCVACGNSIIAHEHHIRQSWNPRGYRHVDCGAIQKKDFFIPVNAGANVSWPIASVQLPDNIETISDIPPNVEEILDQIRTQMKALTDMRNAFIRDKTEFTTWKNSYDDLIQRNNKQEREEIERIRKEFARRRQELAEMQQSVVGEITAVDHLIDAADQTIEEERRKHGKIIDLYSTHKELEELRAEFNDIMSRMPWADLLYAYQEDDVIHTVKVWRDGLQGIINANEMGLGKTTEAGAFIDIFREMFAAEHGGRNPKILWLTRKALVEGTIKELMRWNPARMCAPITGNPAQRTMLLQMAIANNLIVVANYEALQSTPEMMEINWDLVCIDEVHHLKGGAQSSQSLIWKNVRDILKVYVEDLGYQKRLQKEKEAPFAYFLSGSPAPNKLEELWAYLSLFDPEMFPSVRDFKFNFAPYGVLLKERLFGALKGRMIRNDPKEVGIQRPEKTFIWREVELLPQQRELYNKVKRYILDIQLGEDEKSVSLTHIFSVLTRAWQVALWPPSIEFELDGEIYGPDVRESAKVDEVMELIQELGEEQAVIWSARFNPPLYEIARRLQRDNISHALMTADNQDLHKAEHLFQQGDLQILLCQRQSVGEGFNFQKAPDKWPGGASHAILLDRWWNDAGNNQMIDRIWRIDTPRELPVTVHHIVAKDTVDQFVLAILEEKRQELDPVMQSKNLRPLSEWKEILEDLL